MKACIKDESGSSLVIVVLLMGVTLLFAALVIDGSSIMVARNQLQCAVDASALAAASGLTVSRGEAQIRGISISSYNKILQEPLNLTGGEISFPNYKSVQISAQRNIPLFFAQLVAMDSVAVTASAIAQCGNRDIMLLFDRSGSMDDDTVDPEIPQPITDTKIAAYYFIDLVADNTFVVDRIGLVSYSDFGVLERNLDRDFNSMKDKIS
ncbi:hypothetical protein JW935_25470, partial [candidate division KSB1 bacterium]|nr:hypothetical protein [candidate division KSB1 bacterium]